MKRRKIKFVKYRIEKKNELFQPEVYVKLFINFIPWPIQVGWVPVSKRKHVDGFFMSVWITYTCKSEQEAKDVILEFDKWKDIPANYNVLLYGEQKEEPTYIYV